MLAKKHCRDTIGTKTLLSISYLEAEIRQESLIILELIFYNSYFKILTIGVLGFWGFGEIGRAHV